MGRERNYKTALIILIVILIVLIFYIFQIKGDLDYYRGEKLKEQEIEMDKIFKYFSYDWGIGRDPKDPARDFFGLSGSSCQTELEEQVGEVNWEKSDCEVDRVDRVEDFECKTSEITGEIISCFVKLKVTCRCHYILE